MAELKSIADGRTALVWFKPERIKVKPGLNGRDLTTPDNLNHIEALTESIIANGFLQSHPLEVFSEGDDVFVSDGHCRLAAVHAAISQGAKVEKIPCVGEPRGTNDADRILNQDAHNSGKRLTPLELGGNIKRAMALDGTLTVAEVAKRMGRSPTYVNQALDFQAAPAEVHALVKSGKVSATLAASTIRKEGATKGAAKLKAGVETAKANGKAKATAKHVADARPARKALYADDSLPEVRGDKAVIATMRRALEAAERAIPLLLCECDRASVRDEGDAAVILCRSALKMAGA